MSNYSLAVSKSVYLVVLVVVAAVPSRADPPAAASDGLRGRGRIHARPDNRHQIRLRRAQAVAQVLAPGGAESVATAPMTLDDAIAVAFSNHPAIAEGAFRVNAARGRWFQAGRPPNPSIGYQATELGQNGRAGQQGGFIEQEIITGGKRRLDQNVAAAEIRQAQQRLAASRLRVETDVRIAFYRVLVAKRTLIISGELLAVADATAQSARKLRQADLGDEVDVAQARVEADLARTQGARAHNQYQSAWQELAAAMGTPWLLTVDLHGDLEQGLHRLTWNDALERILAASPELAEAVAGVSEAAWSLRRAWAEPIPNVTVQSGVQYDNATGNTISGVQVSVPLPLWNRNRGAIRRAAGELGAAEVRVNRIGLDLHRRLAVAFRRYEDARLAVQLYGRDTLPSAKHALDLATAGWDAGEYDYQKRLIVQRTYSKVSLAYLAALEELWTATIEIEGMLLTDQPRSPQ